jgi:hypothetical protein
MVFDHVDIEHKIMKFCCYHSISSCFPAKGKSKRHKHKDINEKGKAKEGSDMDLFVEEAATPQPAPVVPKEPTPAPVAEVNNVDQKTKTDKPALKVEIKVEESDAAKVQEKNEKNDEKNDEKSHDEPNETNNKITVHKKEKTAADSPYEYKEGKWSCWHGVHWPKFKVIMSTFNHHLPLLGKYSLTP